MGYGWHFEIQGSSRTSLAKFDRIQGRSEG